MKIKSSVIEKYSQLCMKSYLSCDSFEEVKYKIKKCVTLGQVVKVEGSTKHIQYYYNRFIVENGEVIDLYQDKNTYIEVSERVKAAYDRLEGKVVV
ncbi:hypothetical protein HUB98_05515 [Paenibacillus barcinonensis]|uniref:Uncharacterized protein n=1 Tax=Paenibacillus barcinonensis TaxID=198119 RepID=A0A2V4VD33_PAEBA|nr:hypothetical protein [Paenibacillus barcinonensis]PYE51448.1 hypothetical protein DFQ00_102242 [Paenibacillus barcinonensis]QKS55840.1 hypothetical protein HUB98_05515 [Paenibacillus barcinonensis]